MIMFQAGCENMEKLQKWPDTKWWIMAQPQEPYHKC